MREELGGAGGGGPAELKPKARHKAVCLKQSKTYDNSPNIPGGGGAGGVGEALDKLIKGGGGGGIGAVAKKNISIIA